MNEVQIFNNSEFGKIRTVTINGEPWFVGKDIAGALGYKEPTKAARERVDEEDKGMSKIDTPSGMQDMVIINESGLYSLILSSKLPSAKKFKHWVTSEVLPAIRKNGFYGNQTEQLTEVTKQLVKVAETLIQATVSIAQSVNRMVDAVEHLTTEKEITNLEYYSRSRCKLETFPVEITSQVNEMLEDMVQQQNLNFSMIARFCTINGYSISSPSVKTYFEKHFSDN